jgi:sugar phosphate isomerase/epimerase
MKRLGTKLVRIMSFAILDGKPIGEQLAEERFRRLRELKKLFDDAGLIPVHENCMNYGGMGWTCTQHLLENVPGLKLVFDTGNPVFNPDYIKPEPRPRQSSWEFWEKVRDHVVYFHIKDGIWNSEKNGITYTFPGEGQGDVKRIMADAIRRGYNGGISIEPHLSVVFHDAETKSEQDIRYANYVEYGKRMGRILSDLGAKLE